MVPKVFPYFNSKVRNRLLKKVPMEKNPHKNAKKNYQTIHFYEKLSMPFHCRAVQVCLEKLVPKRMKGLSIQGSGID
jgi:hypothetical protein